MFRQELQVMDGKRYIVLECEFKREWTVVRESKHTVTQGEAIEIVEVPDILRS